MVFCKWSLHLSSGKPPPSLSWDWNETQPLLANSHFISSLPSLSLSFVVTGVQKISLKALLRLCCLNLKVNISFSASVVAAGDNNVFVFSLEPEFFLLNYRDFWNLTNADWSKESLIFQVYLVKRRDLKQNFEMLNVLKKLCSWLHLYIYNSNQFNLEICVNFHFLMKRLQWMNEWNFD